MHVIFYVIAALAIIILCVSEHSSHDCIQHRVDRGLCNHSASSPVQTDDNLTYIDKINDMIVNNFNYVMWRQAFIVAIIAGIPIVYYLKDRLPEFFEWVVIGVIVFLLTYFSASWLFVHFFHPNSLQMERALNELRDRLQDGTDAIVVDAKVKLVNPRWVFFHN